MDLKNTSSKHPTPDPGEGAAYLVMAVPFVLAGASVMTLFGLSPVAGVALAAYILIAGAFAVMVRWAHNSIGIRVCLAFSAAFAALSTPLVFVSHAFAYKVLFGAVAALYFLALAVGLWAALKGVFKMLAAVCAVTFVALLVLPPPPGADAPEDRQPVTIDLVVFDENDRYLENAVAQCTVAMARQRTFETQASAFKRTDANGQASFVFSPEARRKPIVCGAFKPATETEQGYALRANPPLVPITGGHTSAYLKLETRTPAGSASELGAAAMPQ